MTDQQRDMFANPMATARQLKARGRFDAALRVLLLALEKEPGDLRLKASLADLYYRMNRPRQALAHAGEILREDPNDPRALVVVGNALLARGKPEEALEHFRMAIDVAPTDYLWGRVARCQLALKQPRAALEALDRADRYARSPNIRLLGLRAACHRALGDSQAERQILSRLESTVGAARIDGQGD